MASASGPIYQAAAIPIKGGMVCMVTSASGKRWVVPQGCLEEGKTAGEIALQEAWEEAGLTGLLDPHPVGSYSYDKWGTTCHVTVFVMTVTGVAEDWPEKAVRERAWLKPAKSLERITDAGLKQVVEGLVRQRRIG